MKLKQFFKFSFTVILASFLGACNNSDSEYLETAASADAQIYAFSLKAKSDNAIDSATYPVLAKTKFAIDQFRYLIYNPDSLPYQTKLKKFAATITYASAGVGKIEFIYPNDSVVEWGGVSDSIDFSNHLYPRIRITAPNGIKTNTYTVDIRIHKINPDKFVWQDVNDIIQQPTSIADQKTMLVGNMFYTFSIDNDDNLYLYKAVRGADYSERNQIAGLNTNVYLQSITLFNGMFYAVDEDRNGYSSEDGTEWNRVNDNIFNIIGVLPSDKAEDDALLVITENDGQYRFAKTSDMVTLIEESLLVDDFPVKSFSAITNFDRNNLNKNLLIVTGGKNANEQWQNLTWLFQISTDGAMRYSSNQKHDVFARGNDITTFMYNDYLYGLIFNRLYKSASFGYKWVSVSDSEQLPTYTPGAKGQSVVVDDENYVWIFGGIADEPVHEVWRGRLNKLIPKGK